MNIDTKKRRMLLNLFKIHVGVGLGRIASLASRESPQSMLNKYEQGARIFALREAGVGSHPFKPKKGRTEALP